MNDVLHGLSANVATAFAASSALWLGTAALLGLCVGSFINVVVYRLPIMLQRQWAGDEAQDTFNLAQPASHCPTCQNRIKIWHNIPVISWLLLRGRCTSCSNAIGMRYPAVELVSAIITVIVAWQFGFGVAAVVAILLSWALIALALIDYDTQLLPDSITLPLLWLGLIVNLFGIITPLESAVIGAIAGYLCLWCVYQVFLRLTGKQGFGFGDFKLLAALGAWLGWAALFEVILMASVAGAVFGIALLISGKQQRDQPMPFGPWLAIAGWISLMWGDVLRTYYFSLLGS